MENTIVLVDDPLFLEHRSPRSLSRAAANGMDDHPERPERLEAARAAVERAVLQKGSSWLRLPARDVSDEELIRVHTEGYIENLVRIDGRQGYLDPDTYFAPASYAAARRAAGGAVALVDALVGGRARYGLALVRPPGHHARPGSAMGFCLLNNVAIAAAHARAAGAERVAIVDWDVHHGNGTQEMFYRDPSVLYVSLHQWPFYPGTGSADEVGTGDGRGYTVNVPLSAGADDAVYRDAFERVIGPVLSEFDPDLLLVSAGFDAHVRDPLASMRVTENGYAEMTRQLARALPRGAAGRIGIVLEGGYDLEGLRRSLGAVLEALDASEGAERKSAPGPSREAGSHEPDLERAIRAAGRAWRLD
jgi:acetoin utilization deacetylase AcuC-like enzyme